MLCAMGVGVLVFKERDYVYIGPNFNLLDGGLQIDRANSEMDIFIIHIMIGAVICSTQIVRCVDMMISILG